MSSTAASAWGTPACVADQPTRMSAASDESTEADSGAEEPSPATNVAAEGGRASGGAGGGLGAVSLKPGSGSPGTTAWWQLVWCHERCHKQDCDEKRATIVDATEESRASLLCLKKAAKYTAWLEQAQRPPYALLTDWREVKPCLQAAALHPPRNQPAFTVILCELPKHYERASAWAQGLPARRDPVHICRDVGMLKGLLADLASKLLGGAALHSRLGVQRGPPGQFNGVARPFALHATTQATGYGTAAWTMDAEAGMEKEYEAIRKQRDSMWLQPVRTVSCLVPAWGAGVRSPLVGATAVGGMEQWSQMHAPSIVAPQSPASYVDQAESPQLLEAMLVNAMPDHYDD